jgi:hypothetical protein
LGQWRIESNDAFDSISKKQEFSKGMADDLASLSKQNMIAVKDLTGRLGESAKVVERMYTSLAKAGGDSLDSLAIRNGDAVDRGLGVIDVKIKQHFDVVLRIVEDLSKSLDGLNNGIKNTEISLVRLDTSAKGVEARVKNVDHAMNNHLGELIKGHKSVKSLAQNTVDQVLIVAGITEELGKVRESIKEGEWGNSGSFFMRATGIETRVTQGVLVVLHAALVFCILVIVTCSPIRGKGWILLNQSISFGGSIYAGRLLDDTESCLKAGIMVCLFTLTSSLIFWLLFCLFFGTAFVDE